jgi:hypothetical protein
VSAVIPDHADCPQAIAQEFAAKGGEVTVSTARPLVAGPHSGDGFVCPHGTVYWVEPTGKQIARWAAEVPR